MLKLFNILLLSLCLTACSTVTTTQGPDDSGIEGQVLIGPMCPVVREGDECPDKPYQANLMVINLSGVKIIQFRTDENGRFHIPLVPGDYVLQPGEPNIIPSASDLTFRVLPGQFTQIIFAYDSGIR